MVKDFEPLFQQRPGWKRIYPDLPGMGRTLGADWIKNQDHVLEVLLEFLDVVIPGERFCAAGVSYGGFMAQGLVLRRAEMMDGAFFMTPAMGIHPDKRNLPDHVILVEDEKIMAGVEPEIADFFRGFAVIQSQELLTVS
jgi:alpha-beta hydrolase superfamily lysophospholipase